MFYLIGNMSGGGSFAMILAVVLAFVFSGVYYFFFTNVASFTLSGELYYSNTLLYFVHYFLELSVSLNIALLVFNLLPIYPLDGFNAIKALTRPNNASVNFMFKYGSLIMLLIIISPLFDILYGLVTENILKVFFNFWGIFS